VLTDLKFDDLNVLITGGSRGIGKACLNLFKSLGANVVAPTRYEFELGDEKNSKKIIQSLGYFDVLILNAGINEITKFEDLEENQLMHLLQVNSFTNLSIIKENLNYMSQKNWGRIIYLSSLFETRAKTGRVMYSMSKSLNGAVVRNLALEYGHLGILTNSVAPGFVMTDLTLKNNDSTKIENIKKLIPVGRLADPIEIARICMFLASRFNTYVNGQSIIVDGGYSCS